MSARRPAHRHAAAGRAAALLAALAATLVIASGTGAAPAASPPACSTGSLVIWLDTNGSGAAGSIYYTVELTNLSGRTCTLQGYPRVAAVDLSGRQVGRGSGRYVSGRPTVQIAGGGTASFVLQVVDVANFSRSACRPVTAAGLRVFPPGSQASKVIPFPLRACSIGPTFLWAQAVRRGS